MPTGTLDPTDPIGDFWYEVAAGNINEGTRFPDATPDNGSQCYDSAHSGGGQLQYWETGGIPALSGKVLTDLVLFARLVGSSGKLPTHGDLILDSVSLGETTWTSLGSGWYSATWAGLSEPLASGLPLDMGLRSAASLIGGNYSGLNSGYVEYTYDDASPVAELTPLIIQLTPLSPQKKLLWSVPTDSILLLPAVPKTRISRTVSPAVAELLTVASVEKLRNRPAPESLLLSPIAPAKKLIRSPAPAVLELSPVAPVEKLTNQPSPVVVEVVPPTPAFAGACVCLSPLVLHLTPITIEYEAGMMPYPPRIHLRIQAPVVRKTMTPGFAVAALRATAVIATPSTTTPLCVLQLTPVPVVTKLSRAVPSSLIDVAAPGAAPVSFGIAQPPIQEIHLTVVPAAVVQRMLPAPLSISLATTTSVFTRAVRPAPLVLNVVPTVRQARVKTAVSPLPILLTPAGPATVRRNNYVVPQILLSPTTPYKKLSRAVTPSLVSVQIPGFAAFSVTPTTLSSPGISLALPAVATRLAPILAPPFPLSVTLTPAAPGRNLRSLLTPLQLNPTLLAPVRRLIPAALSPQQITFTPLSPRTILSTLSLTPSTPLPVNLTIPAPTTALSSANASFPNTPLRTLLTPVPPATRSSVPSITPLQLSLSPQGIVRIPKALGPPDLLSSSDTGLFDTDDITWARVVTLRWTAAVPGDRIYVVRNGITTGYNGYVDANGRCDITFPEASWGPVRYAGAAAYPQESPVLINYWINDPPSPPPTITGGSPNRSGINRLAFQFNAPVTIGSAQDLELTNTTTSSLINMAPATLLGNSTTELLFLLSAVTIPEGNYRAVLPSSAGNHRHDVVVRFHRLIGDLTGDRIVSGSDNNEITAFLNTTGHSYIRGDADGDGSVKSADYTFVASRIGNTLPAEDDD